MPADLDAEFLFPTPAAAPSALSPYQWPGVNPASTQALKDVLKDNHERWHVFFNHLRFHNHAAHRSIAIWSLGADPAVITAGYKVDCEEQRPVVKSPEPITDANFKHHLGDEDSYDAYIDFFTAYVREHGLDETLETFIFSKEYNTGDMEMLTRFLSGLVHPLIHAGYGAEFSLPGTLIEGIAQTCIHIPDVSKLFPKSYFDGVYSVPETALASDTSVHALKILAKVAADPSLTLPKHLSEDMLVQNIIEDHGDAIRNYAMQWTIDPRRPGEINRKVEELCWMSAIIYAVGGWTFATQVEKGKEGDFNADFILVHLVTSAAFIPSLVARLASPRSQILLLRSYLAVSLAWYVARARPKLDIRGFFTSTSSTAYPLPVHPLPTPHKDALLGQDEIQARVPDPWLPIIQSATIHPDSHLPKAIRALATWASKFGTTPPGAFRGPRGSMKDLNGIQSPEAKPGAVEIELPGAEYLNGTLFIRAAGLTMARMGRVGQGEAANRFWDVRGFFEDPKLAQAALARMSAAH